LFLVFLNGFFVAAEFAMVKIRTSRINQLVEEGNARAKLAQRLIKNLDAYLSATQLGITLASLGLGWVGEPAIARLIEPPLHALGVSAILIHTISFVIAFATITFLHIVLGELAPKSLAIHRAEGIVMSVAKPMIYFYRIMYPFIAVLNGAANKLVKLVGIEPATEGEMAHTEEEIRILMNQSLKSGLINNTEMVLFDNIFEFADRIAREVMVPRIDMVTLDFDIAPDKVLEVVEAERHTRYPVIREDKDHIIGFVHVKDLWLQMQRKEQFSLQAILRHPVMISEAMEISAVLKLMQKNKTEMAIVIDEYGGTAGLITTEDIIEELVGEIQDEFDDELAPVVKVKDGYSVEGRFLVEEVNDLLGIHLDNTDIDTIGGWIFSVLGRTPEVGDSVEQEGHKFVVTEMEDTRVERILISRVNMAKQQAPATQGV
jgi:CBS domain containing-hemolysin-like protein